MPTEKCFAAGHLDQEDSLRVPNMSPGFQLELACSVWEGAGDRQKCEERRQLPGPLQCTVTVCSRDLPVQMGASREPGLLSLLSTRGSNVISVCLSALSA